jgi:hypothetical protein
MRIRRIKASDIKRGALITGETLLEATDALNIDNMEGIAAHRSPSGETILTLISDDNFSALERTLLTIRDAGWKAGAGRAKRPLGSLGLRALHLGDFALEALRLERQFFAASFEQICVEAAAMLHRAQRRGADGKTHPLLERFAFQRHVAQIGQEPALGSALGVADIIAGEHRFAGQLATTGHRT